MWCVSTRRTAVVGARVDSRDTLHTSSALGTSWVTARQLLPMYNVILRAICLTLVLRFVCWVFISKSSLTFDFVNWVLACPFIAMLRDGVAVFLCMNSAGYDAMRRTALFMLLWGLGLGAVGWFYWLHSDAFDNDFGTYFFVVYNACGALLHLAVLAVKLVQRVAFKTHLAVRPAPILYSAFLVVILGLFLFIDVQAVVNVVVYGCMYVRAAHPAMGVGFL